MKLRKTKERVIVRVIMVNTTFYYYDKKHFLMGYFLLGNLGQQQKHVHTTHW